MLLKINISFRTEDSEKNSSTVNLLGIPKIGEKICFSYEAKNYESEVGNVKYFDGGEVLAILINTKDIDKKQDTSFDISFI